VVALAAALLDDLFEHPARCALVPSMPLNLYRATIGFPQPDELLLCELCAGPGKDPDGWFNPS
jgi:hypothetical protein